MTSGSPHRKPKSTSDSSALPYRLTGCEWKEVMSTTWLLLLLMMMYCQNRCWTEEDKGSLVCELECEPAGGCVIMKQCCCDGC